MEIDNLAISEDVGKRHLVLSVCKHSPCQQPLKSRSALQCPRLTSASVADGAKRHRDLGGLFLPHSQREAEECKV